jgi:DNA-binding LytR/AlgR family response regulator
MPGLTGLQFIKTMSVKPMIILITAYERYALEGFNLDVTDYLLKPVSFDRFMQACTKAKDLFDLRFPEKEIRPVADPGYFFVHADYSMIKITTADITYIEGLKDYIRINLKSSQKPVITRMPMKTIEEQLPASMFLRIHKSYIAGIAHITAIRKSSVFIGNIELPVTDSYRDAITYLTGRAG